MVKDEKGGNMSKIAGDINAEMMKKAIHDSRAKLFAEIVGKTGSQQSVIDCAMQEIESLRQQVAELTLSSDTYFAERSSARDAWRRASKERDAHIKREVMLREDLEYLLTCKHGEFCDHYSEAAGRAKKTLAATADLENVRLCEKEPVALVPIGAGVKPSIRSTCGINCVSEKVAKEYTEESILPLYRAWEPK